MKRILGLAIACSVLAGVAHGEPLPADKVPANVQEALRAKFPGVSKVEWKLKEDKNYEAEFTLESVEIAAKFDDRGKWLETETSIEQSALPKKVSSAIAKHYKGYKIIETQKVELAGDKPILFEVHLENAEEILKLQLQRSGTVISKSSKKKGA